MSEKRNLEKVSITDLEKEKIQVEIDILKAQFEKDFPKRVHKKRLEQLSEFSRKWIAVILAGATLISAILGVVIPLNDFLVEQRKKLEYELNGDMIGFVDALSSDDEKKAKEGVMMLSYYETNSIPILLFYLENSEVIEDEVLRKKIIETISMIYANNKSKKIIKEISQGIRTSFDHLKTTDDRGGQVINLNKRYALGYYLELLNTMKLNSRHQDDIKDLFIELKGEICEDKFLKNEIDTFFDNISSYLGEKKPYKCN